MGSLLGRIQAQNECWMQKLPPANTRFRGVIFPTSPTALPTSVFVLPRLGLRTRMDEPVRARDLFTDPTGRIMLVGNHDISLSGNLSVSRLYVLFQMTERAPWSRQNDTQLHPVTHLPMAKDPQQQLGPIWISLESYTHGNEDPGVRITTDRLRVITAARLKLGDLVKGQTVKRINETLGVTIAEIE